MRDAVLFAIEVSPSMIKEPKLSDSRKADRDSPALAALKCAYHMMQQRIISNPKDMIGIVLYGTESFKFHDEEMDDRGGPSYPNCYLLTDLDVPDANDVRTLKQLVEEEWEAKKLLVPSSEPVPMSNVLLCANQIFTTKAPNFLSRRLFIVTDNDNPHPVDKSARTAAVTRAKDLYDLGVTIDLFPVSTASHNFEPKTFYDDIIYRTSPDDPDAPAYLPSSSAQKKLSSGGDGISLLSSLLSDITSKSTVRRALFANIPLEFGPNFKISVKGYLILKPQKPTRSCYIYLGADKPQIVKGHTTQLADDTARAVEKWEVRKAFKFGGETISFTTDEMSQLRNFGDPVIRIIGFKPLDSLPVWAATKYPTYLYPSEEDYVGSTRVFSALYQTLRSSRKFGIAWFIARRNAAPVLAALIPTIKPTEEDEGSPEPQPNFTSLLPSGIYLLPLPFVDDIRSPPSFPDHFPRSTASLTNAFHPVCQQLQLPKGAFDPSRYPSPALQWHYRILQALALEEDIPEQPEDRTIPKYKSIDRRAGHYVLEWGKRLEEAYLDYQKENPSATSILAKRERGTGAAENGEPRKRAKIEKPGGALADDEMRSQVKRGTLNKLTVGDLKEWLTRKKLPIGGRKGELIERVEGWFEQ